MEKFQVIGQMVNASNSTLVVESDNQRFIYKPKSGERPLWDFPDHTLYKRERAAYVTSELLGWEIVPETTIQEGPYGVGSFQQWIDAEPTTVDIFPPNTVPEGWLTIVTGIDEEGNEVTLAHEDTARLQQIALFDALINNADRKFGHILITSDQMVFGCDHGVSLHEENKLRTVIWQFAELDLLPFEIAQLSDLQKAIDRKYLKSLLSDNEIEAIFERVSFILQDGRFATPSPNWPAVPWPPY
jgi:uncharacterized repeat protein (TIGR03843 family)